MDTTEPELQTVSNARSHESCILGDTGVISYGAAADVLREVLSLSRSRVDGLVLGNCGLAVSSNCAGKERGDGKERTVQ